MEGVESQKSRGNISLIIYKSQQPGKLIEDFMVSLMTVMFIPLVLGMLGVFEAESCCGTAGFGSEML